MKNSIGFDIIKVILWACKEYLCGRRMLWHKCY